MHIFGKPVQRYTYIKIYRRPVEAGKKTKFDPHFLRAHITAGKIDFNAAANSAYKINKRTKKANPAAGVAKGGSSALRPLSLRPLCLRPPKIAERAPRTRGTRQNQYTDRRGMGAPLGGGGAAGDMGAHGHFRSWIFGEWRDRLNFRVFF